MSAEVAANRPHPDPEADRVRRGDTPVAKTSSRPNDQPDPRHAPGATARLAAGTLTSHRVAALPVLDRLLTRLHLAAFLRDQLPGEDSRSRVPTATALLLSSFTRRGLIACA